MLSGYFHKILKAFTTQRMHRAGTGAAIGALVAIIFYMIVYATYMQTGLSSFLNYLLIGGAVLTIALIIFILVLFGFKIIQKVRPIILAIIATTVILSLLCRGSYFSLPFILLQLLCGAAISLIWTNDINKIVKALIIAIIVTINLFVFFFLFSPGFDGSTEVKQAYWTQPLQPLQMSDPAKTGNYPVATLFYGSGNDRHRPEYGKKISIKTESVDATSFFDQTKGLKNWLRKFYWGFNSKNYPINARVWYPNAEGTFPLVLIVHGNHLMTDYSDAGYEYIGRLLASKGYIVASIDQNFLNYAWFGDYYFSELFVRGWLLLKHLENWRAWNHTPGSVFYKKVDINNIALIGHSRGGEAAYIAAFLNNLDEYPLDAKQKFNFKFPIKGIVQIAPTDVYTMQAEIPITINDINYLSLHGGYDQDMYWYTSSRIFNKIKFTDSNYHFKSSLYIYSANHGQFNTVWGWEDDNPPASWFLNKKAIMPEEEQRKIAQLYISAFLETTLKGNKEYMPLFTDYRYGLSLLPKDYYINMFADSRFQYLARYNEDTKVTTGTADGCYIEGTHLTKWKEDAIPLRMENGSTQNNVGVFLGWDTNTPPRETATYTLHIPDSVLRKFNIQPDGLLTFNICNNTNDIDSIDFSIELLTKKNIYATTLSSNILLPPLLKTSLTKKNPFYRIKSESNIERVMQHVEIPFTQFGNHPLPFHPSELISVRFTFDKTPAGEVILDNIGFK